MKNVLEGAVTWDGSPGAAEADEQGGSLVGRVLDQRYQVVELISSGGVGAVYRAVQSGVVERNVAIKVLRPALTGALGRVQRFEHEARITAQLRHPNTVRVLDAGRLDNGQLFLVTEHLEGTPLDLALSAGPLEVLRAVRVARQISASMSEAHALGVVHRDLKPSNVFLEPIGGQEIVKVLDFGMAKLVHFPGLTAPATMCGTPGYMAPEQILGLRVDARTDVYALGVLLHQCLTGVELFSAPTAMDLLVKHLRQPPPRVGAVRGVPVPEALEALVASMLAKVPDDRPPTMAAVDAHLAAIEHALSTQEHARHVIEHALPAHTHARHAVEHGRPARDDARHAAPEPVPASAAPADDDPTEALPEPPRALEPTVLSPVPDEHATVLPTIDQRAPRRLVRWSVALLAFFASSWGLALGLVR